MIRFLQQDSRITKFIFWAIILVVAAFMVVTLIPGIFSAGPTDGSQTYATIRNGGFYGRYLTTNSEVSTIQVQRLAARMLQQQKLPDMLMPYAMRQASQSLVQEQVLGYEAARLGLEPTNADLRQELQKGSFGEYLFPESKYIGDDRYGYFISTQFNMSVAEFENTLKREMAIARLQQFVTAGVTVSDTDVRKQYMDQGTKVKFDYAVLTQDELMKQINPSDSDLQSYFTSHAKQYANAVPESRKLQYLSFDPSQVPGGATAPTDDELHAYYQKNIAQFEVKEQAKVRHILIAVKKGSDPATDAAAKKKAEDIRKQILAGGDFAKLAQANSDDPGSKTQGGELGYIHPGQTVPEFEKAAFSLQPGQTSDLVRTEFGYHIIQTEERQTAHTRSFDEVKAQIEPVVARDTQLNAAKNYGQQLATEAGKSGLEKTAAAHHLQVQTTDYLARNATVPGVPDGAPMLTGAFASKVGAAPQVVSTGEGFAVYTVADIHAAHAPAFAEYKSHILDDYRSEQAPAMLTKKTQELADAAKSGNLEQAARSVGADYKTSDLVGSDGTVPEIGAIAASAPAIFALNQGQVSGPLTSGRSGFVVKLEQKQEPTAQDLAAHLDETKDKLLNEKRERFFSVFVGNLMDRYKTEKRILQTKQATTPQLGQAS